VYEQSAEDGSEVNTVTIPIVFGRALTDPYGGFGQRTVVAGDTLSSIAASEYGDATLFPRIFEANRDQLHDPNLIHPGQVLRIPR
jgi:nucleoid-associated protein YgaU